MSAEFIFGTPKNLTATGNICARAGYITGVWVSSASATPTLAFYDSATTTTTTLIANTFTPLAATWFPIPFHFSNGCYVVVAGTVDCTVGIVAS